MAATIDATEVEPFDTEQVEIDIAELEVALEDLETRRLDLPVNAVAERITLRQTQRELESELSQLRRAV